MKVGWLSELCRWEELVFNALLQPVRPLLEYCSCIWSPHFKNGIYKVESVQRNFTKRLRAMSDLSYTDRLAVLNLPSLELRHLRNDLIWCYKILFGVVEMPVHSFFEFSDPLALLNSCVVTALNCLKGVATLVQGLGFQWVCSKCVEFITSWYRSHLCSRL